MVEVSYYNAASNEGGQGLWRTAQKAASHIARIARATPDAIIDMHPESERETTRRDAMTILEQVELSLPECSCGARTC